MNTVRKSVKKISAGFLTGIFLALVLHDWNPSCSQKQLFISKQKYLLSNALQNCVASICTSSTWRRSASQTPPSTCRESQDVGRATQATPPHGRAPHSRPRRRLGLSRLTNQVTHGSYCNSTPHTCAAKNSH